MSKLSPRRHYSRKSNSANAKILRSYEAGNIDRFTTLQQSTSFSANADIYRALPIVRARSRHERDNGDYGKRFIDLCVKNIVGPDGIHLQIQTDNPAVNEQILTAWLKWTKSCTLLKKEWIDVQNLAVENLPRDGENLLKFVVRNERLYLQFLDIDLLDHQKNDPQTNTIMGVQCNDDGLPIAYHILNKHPSDWFEPNKSDTYYNVIPADQIVHTFREYRPLQRRGMPWGHTVYKRLSNLNGYEDAEVVAARTGACNTGFFTKNPQGEGFGGDDPDKTDDDIGYPTDAEPGVFYELPNGVSFQSFNPTHPAGNYGPFVKGVLHGIACGYGVSYMSLTGDLSEANFSSMKWGEMSERETWISLQNWFIRNFCKKIFAKWLEIELFSGRLKVPFSLYEEIIEKSVWRGRRWIGIDRAKDQAANRESILMNTMSYSDAIRQDGRDPDTVWHELAKDKERLKELGLIPISDAPANPEPLPEPTQND